MAHLVIRSDKSPSSISGEISRMPNDETEYYAICYFPSKLTVSEDFNNVFGTVQSSQRGY
jgi:hypothetical protein